MDLSSLSDAELMDGMLQSQAIINAVHRRQLDPGGGAGHQSLPRARNDAD